MRLKRPKLDAGPSPSMPDEVLVRAAVAGNRDAFDVLQQKHGDQLRQFLTAKLAPDDLEDVFQETWIAAWNSIARFDRRSRFTTWLYGIALNKCRDAYRSMSGPRQHARLPDGEAGPSVEGPYLETDLRVTIRAVLGQLTEAQREVLELYYFSDFTLPEISKLLNRNLNTVKYQFYRAHAESADRLRSILPERQTVSGKAMEAQPCP